MLFWRWTRRGSSFPVGLDSPLEDSPVGHGETIREDVTFHKSRRSEVELFPCRDVSEHGAVNRDRSCDEVGFDRRVNPDGQTVVADLDRSLELTVDGEIAGADNVTSHENRLANARRQTLLIKRWLHLRLCPLPLGAIRHLALRLYSNPG